MAGRLSVVISQGQSAHPAKRGLEQELVAALLGEPRIDVVVVPHLYDLAPEGSGVLALNGIRGDMVVVSWLYPRAAHWVLAQHGIHGQMGTTLLRSEEEQEATSDESSDDQAPSTASEPETSQHASLPNAASATQPTRRIYCLDFRASRQCADFVEEIRRIASETSVETVDLLNWIGGSPTPQQLNRYLAPRNSTASASDATGPSHSSSPSSALPLSAASASSPTAPHPATNSGRAGSNGNGKSNGNRGGHDHQHDKPHDHDRGPLLQVDETPKRRWYPVIDYARCTNCMECIDFCLFGVYGVDSMENILVEQPDNCRKGCPACSRICPENAILFPQHKSPAIAGSPIAEAGAFKIDLSKLFGGGDPLETAVEERDRELLAAGREAVGTSVGIPKRQADRQRHEPKDELDDLIDQLDEADL